MLWVLTEVLLPQHMFSRRNKKNNIVFFLLKKGPYLEL